MPKQKNEIAKEIIKCPKCSKEIRVFFIICFPSHKTAKVICPECGKNVIVPWS